eukprot:261402-Pelagomonas_calceolata.AAC.3
MPVHQTPARLLAIPFLNNVCDNSLGLGGRGEGGLDGDKGDGGEGVEGGPEGGRYMHELINVAFLLQAKKWDPLTYASDSSAPNKTCIKPTRSRQWGV